MTRKLIAKLVLAIALTLAVQTSLKASDPLIGEIRMFGGNFAPRGWAFCDGQLLPISNNTALFSILGTTYGGDGRTTFALPDLRGRAAVGVGRGPGLTEIRQGEKRGSETVIPQEAIVEVTPKTRKTLPVAVAEPQNNLPPSLGIRYIIALQGVYPSRN